MQLLGYRRSIIKYKRSGVLHFETRGKFGWCMIHVNRILKRIFRNKCKFSYIFNHVKYVSIIYRVTDWWYKGMDLYIKISQKEKNNGASFPSKSILKIIRYIWLLYCKKGFYCVCIHECHEYYQSQTFICHSVDMTDRHES